MDLAKYKYPSKFFLNEYIYIYIILK